ncbi:MAG: preprotein translocase subunit YajC [Firmicutes bacterium]|nr:preprotein translocase subunit YajC [Bacillota bacterium]
MHKTGGTSIYWIFFLLLIAMTVWMFWQQSRQQRARREVQNSVAKGDRVVTVGGVIGTVEEVDGNELTLRIADGVKIRVLKSAIGGKYQKSPGETSS